jgi:hypothetical protein
MYCNTGNKKPDKRLAVAPSLVHFGARTNDDLEAAVRAQAMQNAQPYPGDVLLYLIAAYQAARTSPGSTMENRWDTLYLPSYFDAKLPQPTSMACSAGSGCVLFHYHFPAKRLQSTKLALHPRKIIWW